LVLASTVIVGSEFRGTLDHILISQIRDSPNLEGQVAVFISPRNGVARLYPQARCSLFVASYDLEGYSGGIRPHLDSGLYSLDIESVVKRLMGGLYNVERMINKFSLYLAHLKGGFEVP
jgi:hypothetical protein